jgi:hypothetical protein
VDDDRRHAVGCEHIDADRGVGHVGGEGVADAYADPVAVQPGPEQLPRRVVQPPEVEVEAARATPAHLHRGEVPVARHLRGRLPQLRPVDGPAVDLDALLSPHEAE